MRYALGPTPTTMPTNGLRQIDSQSDKPVSRVLNHIAAYLDVAIRRLTMGVKVDDYYALKEFYSQTQCDCIDYDKYGHAFAKWYFLENFWKAALTYFKIEDQSNPRAASILDVG